MMRAADLTTIIRTLLVFPVAYAILAKYDALAIILVIGIMYVMDILDGYFALAESKGNTKVTRYGPRKGLVGEIRFMLDVFSSYLEKPSSKKKIKTTGYGPRLDIAGDRAIEYVFWFIFTYVGLVPLFVLFIIILRHSFVDALMGEKGTSGKNKTAFAQFMYSSNFGRGFSGALKAVTFSYLALVYIDNYPLIIGQALVFVLVAYIVLRGLSEIRDYFA